MKYMVERYNSHTLVVIARNLRVAKSEMKRDFPFFRFHATLSNASNSKGEIGKYVFKSFVSNFRVRKRIIKNISIRNKS